MTIYTLIIIFQHSQKICKIPSPDRKYITRIPILTHSTDLIYPCKPKEIITTFEPITSVPTNMISDTSTMPIVNVTKSSKSSMDIIITSNNPSSNLSNLSNESFVTVTKNTDHLNVITGINKLWKVKFISYEEENNQTKSVVDNSSNIIPRPLLARGYKNDKIQYMIKVTTKSTPESISPITTKSNLLNKLTQISTINKTTLLSSNESKYSTESDVRESFNINGKISITTKPNLQNSEYLAIKDIISFSFVSIGIIILLLERRRRRKISRQVQNYVHRSKFSDLNEIA
ncbi:hypothetical protein RF11_03089 [Thelohanellus kitauei]|uniref:Uncharacterized protein n=1 Tax=Thelohanellus kitauei TaxID=669202 RepID=A0A0C2N051_THEKT|nr:hypothetical protein RF11_03089 [Thelohanellus kitauei]